jgi:enoyl-CoA hydratase/carnithine racemase
VTYETILYDVRDHVAHVTLNRPEVMNAISYQMTREIIDVGERITADDDVRAVILSGAGERAFCTGLDLKERATTAEPETPFQRRRQRSRRAVVSHHQAIAALDKPVIAAIRGYAVGGGLELALACDLRVCSEDARLGMMEVRRGRLGGAGGTQRLPRLIGAARATELLLTGLPVDGAEAYRIGLVNRLAPEGGALAAARALAADICACAPSSVRLAKQAVDQGLELSLEEGLVLEQRLLQEAVSSPNFGEGVLAFLEKRDAVWASG